MRVIAALPFANQSRPEDGFLADALTELLIAELGKAGRLEIISWNSTRHYRNTDRPWNHVARQLGAEGIISGSLARTGDSFRIQAALINPKAAEPVWRRGFRREIRRLPEVLRSIVKDIARDTGAGLTPAEKRRLSRGPEWDGSALESYWRALHAWNELSEDAFKEAITQLLGCLRREPEFAPAYARLAFCYSSLGLWGLLPAGQAYPRARLAAQKAIELDASLPLAHYALSLVLWLFDWEGEAAETHMEKALVLNPSLAEARWARALYLASARQCFDAATAEIDRAMDLDPAAPLYTSSAGWISYWARRADDAIERFWEAIEADGRLVSAWQGLGLAYLLKGKCNDAVNALERAAAVAGDPYSLGLLGAAYATAGEADGARARLEAFRIGGAVAPPSLPQAWIRIGLGDKARAIELLRAAVAEHDVQLFWMGAAPLYDPLREEPRFQELLRKISKQQTGHRS